MKELIWRIVAKDQFYPAPREITRKLSESPYRDAILSYLASKEGVRRLLRWPKHRGGELTDIGILRHFLAGNIQIDPFDINRLQSNGYDISLGEYYYVCFDKSDEEKRDRYPRVQVGSSRPRLFNPVDEEDVKDSYRGPLTALNVSDLARDRVEGGQAVDGRNMRFLEGLTINDRVIILPPNQMILGHTDEYIGGRNVIDTQISGKSTTGRMGVGVCSDANKGDVGFSGRWTLEITNKHPDTAVLLVVGQPIATITFLEVEEPIISYGGRYTGQIGAGSWTPERMLPKWRRK